MLEVRLLGEESLSLWRELNPFDRMGKYDQVTLLMEESLVLFREIENLSLVGFTLAGLGALAICQRKYERARDLLEESLAIRVTIGDKGGIAWCLEKLVEAKHNQSQFDKAARIFGQVEALRAPIRFGIDPVDPPEYSRIISELPAALEEDTFATLWNEEAAMELEQVIEVALSETAPAVVSTQLEKERFGGLTAREWEVAALITQGKSNREIAEMMTVAVKTIETYVTRILNKLGFDSRVQIATWAVEMGLR